jgi:hypothetical protein
MEIHHVVRCVSHLYKPVVGDFILHCHISSDHSYWITVHQLSHPKQRPPLGGSSHFNKQAKQIQIQFQYHYQ